MDVPGLRQRLSGTAFTDLSWVAETGSTNTDLLDAARQGAPSGRVLVTDHQSAGRGRRGRGWEDPPGSSLLVSVLFRPGLALAPVETHVLTMATALSVADSVYDVVGIALDLKWPNDLVVDGGGPAGYRKVAGILAESIVAGGKVEAVVVGTGLNVNWPASQDLPAELAERATALNHLAGRPLDRAEVLVDWLLHLDRRWGLVLDGHGQTVVEEYRDRLSTVGRDVAVQTDDGEVRGRATDVMADGRLVVDDGTRRHVLAAGDIVHLRPADPGS
jgi:BirA family transcriptional regulator, biotin operon repressor / biotin---[acetyl-CoA-carboxylase] ligase